MNREEIIAILKVLKVAYPRFYNNITKEDMLKTIDLWGEMFKNDSKQDITRAVKELICELEFPPSIAEIKKKINKYKGERAMLEKIKKEELTSKQVMQLDKPKEIETKQKVNAKKYIDNIKNAIFGGKQ